MKRKARLLIAIALVLALVFSGTGAAFGATGSPAAPVIKVMYDGNYITFKDAVPKIINGRTMVPFRQILEDMGTVVTYDLVTKTVLAKKGTTEFSFVIGGSDITIKENGVTTIKKMDVVPYLDRYTNRTYVSARFMAESLGYGVGWDGTAKVVVITDYEKLFANADTDFSILNKLMETDIDLEKTYRTTGSFDASFTTPASPMDEDSGPLEFAMTGDYNGIQHKTDADMVMHMAMDADKAIAAMPADQQAMAEASFEAFKDMTIKIKMNGTEGVMYMNAGMFSMIDPTIDANTWMKMDIFKQYEDMGIDLKNLMNLSKEKTSVGMMLTQSGATYQAANVNTYANVKASYAFLKNLIGDEAFDKTVSGSKTTYTLNITPLSIAAAISKASLTDGGAMSLSDIAEMTNLIKEADFSGELIIDTVADKMTAYQMNGDFSADGTEVAFDLNGTPMDTDMTMNISMEGIMAMAMSITSSMKETTDQVNLTLPAGAKIVDFNTMMP